MWLQAITAPPEVGMCSAPSTVIFRSSTRNIAFAAAMTGGYTTVRHGPHGNLPIGPYDIVYARTTGVDWPDHVPFRTSPVA